MSNTITIELSAEDRARLDRLSAALEKATAPEIPSEMRRWGSIEEMAEFAKAAHAEAAVAAQEPATEPEPATPENVTPEAEEAPWEAPWEAPAAENVPVPTAEELQAVVQDLAKPGSPHRAAVRDIVKSYAERVSLIPEDKRAEVMEKLQALKEGKA